MGLLAKHSDILTSKHTKNEENNVLTWDNFDNNAFYEIIKADGLKKFAERRGLAAGCDIELLKPIWSKASSILEIGAGYGRVINALLSKNYTGKISAIERCASMMDALIKTYSNKINLFKNDLHNLGDIDEKFDVILWLWSGIGDFSKEEQPIIVKHLKKLLQENGTLIIDTIAMDIMPLEVIQHDRQLYTINVNEYVKYIYEPNTAEIKQYAKEAGFKNFECTSYQTDSSYERLLYILS
jgi:SAM-dependent methyltransferase